MVPSVFRNNAENQKVLLIFHAIYGAVCIRFTHFSYDDYENKYTLS